MTTGQVVQLVLSFIAIAMGAYSLGYTHGVNYRAKVTAGRCRICGGYHGGTDEAAHGLPPAPPQNTKIRTGIG